MSIDDDNEKLNADFKYNRAIYKELIEHGREALKGIKEVATGSEHPRAFEVYFGGLKQVADMNDKLLELHRKKQVIKLDNQNQPEQLAIEDRSNSRAFVGSSSELAEALERGEIDLEALEAEFEIVTEDDPEYDTDGYNIED